MISVPSSLTRPEASREIPQIASPSRAGQRTSHTIVSDVKTRFHGFAVGATLLRPALIAFALLMLATPAFADFRLCNNTGGRVGIALGYKDGEGWITEGWWNLAPRSCETLLRGGLVARFYYIYAIDYDRGGEWSGQAFMCSRDKEFTIRGTEDCLARGYDRTGFFEVDTGEQRAWTVQLTESSEAPRGSAPAGASPPAVSPPATAPPGAPPQTAPPSSGGKIQ
jgi:uncharacterized membrane protein